ncbi:MAG: hypothetical protein ACM3TT_08815 [Syntrophothermus sp.]
MILSITAPSQAQQTPSVGPQGPEQPGASSPFSDVPRGLTKEEMADLEELVLEFADELANLSNRANAAEAAIAELSAPRRIQISGGLTWYLEAYHGNLPFNPADKQGEEVRAALVKGSIPGIRQIAYLQFDTGLVDSRFHLGLRNIGHWGVDGYTTASFGINTYPRDPFRIEELYVRFPWKYGNLTLGRQYFELGPLGLLTSATPRTAEEALDLSMELIRLDLGTDPPALRRTLLVGRWNTNYYTRTNYVSSADEYAALRLEKAFGSWTAGLNLLASGYETEEGASLDLSGQLGGRRFVSEIAGYARQHGERWGMGGMVQWPLWEVPQGSLKLTVGSFSPEFDPFFSMVSRQTYLRFFPGSTGYHLAFTRRLPKGWLLDLENRNLYRQAANGGIAVTLAEAQLGFSKALSNALHLALQYRYTSSDNGKYGRFQTTLVYQF